MRPSDIYSLTSVADPQISPDGRHIAYVVDRIDGDENRYRSQIWTVATDAAATPRALTSGEHRDSQPRWSPDGSRIAFTSTRKNDDGPGTRSSLHLLPFAEPGETVTLAESDEKFTDLAWSPDGSQLALTMRARSDHYAEEEKSHRPARRIDHLHFTLNGEGFITDRPQHVHLVATDGSGELRDVTPGRHEFHSPAWFPDGQRMAVGVNRFRDDFARDVAVLADLTAGADGADVRLLTEGTGEYRRPTVTPDGSGVVVVGYEDFSVQPQNRHLGLLDPESVGTPEWLTQSIDRTWATMLADRPPQWTEDQQLVTALEDRGNIHLYRVLPTPTAGESPERLVGGDLSVTGWSCGRIDGADAIAFTATTAVQPAELFLSVDGETRQLTDVSSSFKAAVEPRPAEHFVAPTGDVEVDAWLFRPHDFDPSKKYPALLNIHGGPFTQYGNYFFDEFQMQAEAGYVVLCSNPRGGSGREQAWADAIRGPKHPVPGTGWGSVDFDDCMAVVDAALEQFDFIDPARLGVLGGSYGGYMTTWTVTHTNKFAAACSERAVNNLVSLEYGSDIAGFFYSEIGPTFVDDPDEYMRMSPITYVKDLDTPLLIIHSEDDLRCPADQATQLFTACRVLGKPDVEYWLFPGEDHELSRSGSPFHRRQRAEIILEFFDRYLKR